MHGIAKSCFGERKSVLAGGNRRHVINAVSIGQSGCSNTCFNIQGNDNGSGNDGIRRIRHCSLNLPRIGVLTECIVRSRNDDYHHERQHHDS